MTDLAIQWDNDRFGGDLALVQGRLATDDGLRTAMLISLFTDARARGDDPLPQPGTDPRGWWGNGFALHPGRELGSRLWLLEREKLTRDVVARARAYAAEALAWLEEEALVSGMVVETARLGDGTLAIGVIVDRPEGPARQRYDFVWEASL